MDRLYSTAVVGSVALLLVGCGSSETPQPTSPDTPAAGGQLRVTLYIADMADRLEIL